MIHKVEITVDVIVHATEDILRIFQSFEDYLDLKESDFTVNETVGHFENPITILNVKIVKKQAHNFMRKLVKEIEERTEDSRFHMRIDKQELIKGNIVVSEKETVKVKIHTPIYNKKDTIKIFTEIFQCHLG